MTATSLMLVVAAPLVCGPPPAAPVPPRAAPEDPRLETLYRGARTFEDFLASAEGRRELWLRNADAGLPEALIERARAIGGTWRILAIAEDWCSDSVNTVPFLGTLAERVDGIELRVIDSETGRAVMEAYRTPDGRSATPTILVLDRDYEEAGCWVERPSELQAWALEIRPTLDDREFLRRKMAWYAEDAGSSTVGEVLSVIEAAAAGTRLCPGAP